MSSNDTNIRQLQLATQYLALGIGFPILIIGIVGNLLNISVFLAMGTYKSNASSFYMLAKSCFDLSALIIGLTGQILIQGFRSSAFTSVTWCRFRIPLLYISSLSAYTCLCLQSIDSFLRSSSNVILRQQSTVRRAHYLVLGFLFIWICNESPYYFIEQQNVIPNWRCQGTNTIYAQYRTYFTNLGLLAITPIVINSLFGYLSYRNMRSLTIGERRTLTSFSRQMIRMTLFAVSVVVIFYPPYVIAQVYFTVTANLPKDVYRQTQEQLANVFFFIYEFNTNASSFYCYCAASKRFRRQVLQLFKQMTIGQTNNRIIPLRSNDQINLETRNNQSRR